MDNTLVVMGLDLSLTSTGISVKGKTSAFRSKNKGVVRLIDIATAVINECVANQVTAVAVEGYAYSSRNSHSHSIGEMGGVVKVELFKQGIKVVEIPPTCRAKFATGKGNAGKNEVVSAISAKTGIVWGGASGDDECDAWILEQMALAHLGLSPYDWSSTQLSALDKVDWTGLNG